MPSIDSIYEKNCLFWKLSQKEGHTFSFDEATRKKILCPSTSLSEIFQEVKLLGQGKSGEVTLIKDMNDRCFAIKKGHGQSYLLQLLNQYSSSDSDSELAMDDTQEFATNNFIQAFFDEDGISKPAQCEFRKSLLLDHPTIVKVDSLFSKVQDDEVSSFLLMEYIDGTELGGVNPGSFDRSVAYAGLDNVLGGLIHLIDKGLVPTDLNASNIIVAADQFRIVDLEGHETLEEAENSDAQDSTLEDRLDEIWSLYQLFSSKSLFHASEQEVMKEFKNSFFAKKPIQDQLDTPVSAKNVGILRSFIEGIQEKARFFLNDGVPV